MLVAGYYGVDLTGLMTGQPVSQQQSTRSISPNEDEAAKFTSVILATTEDTQGQQFEKMGKTYQQPKLVMYRGMTRTGCGQGQSIMGPFYCPADGTVYIDLSFYDDMKDKLGADGDLPVGTLSLMKSVIMCRNCWASSRKFVNCNKTRRRRK